MKRSLPFFFLLLMALPMWASHPVCGKQSCCRGGIRHDGNQAEKQS